MQKQSRWILWRRRKCIVKGEGETNYTINWEVPGEGKKIYDLPDLLPGLL